MFRVAGLPKRPQLLTQRMRPSGILQSVSSFSLFQLSWAIISLDLQGSTPKSEFPGELPNQELKNTKFRSHNKGRRSKTKGKFSTSNLPKQQGNPRGFVTKKHQRTDFWRKASVFTKRTDAVNGNHKHMTIRQESRKEWTKISQSAGFEIPNMKGEGRNREEINKEEAKAL